MLINISNISPLSTNVLSFLSDLASNNKIDKIIVFGSRAIGDFEKFSDLDLAIDAPYLTKYEWLKLKEFAIYDLKSIIRISLVHFSTNPPKLKESITKTGVIIYERQS